MTRGHQKTQAQAKNLAKKKSDKGSEIDAQKAGQKLQCSICMQPLSNYGTLVSHYEAKHPKAPVPTKDELGLE